MAAAAQIMHFNGVIFCVVCQIVAGNAGNLIPMKFNSLPVQLTDCCELAFFSPRRVLAVYRVKGIAVAILAAVTYRMSERAIMAGEAFEMTAVAVCFLAMVIDHFSENRAVQKKERGYQRDHP
jgi:hypothetical protein